MRLVPIGLAALALLGAGAAAADAAPRPTTAQAKLVTKRYAAQVRTETDTTRSARYAGCEKTRGQRKWTCYVRVECLDDYVKAVTLRIRPLKSLRGRLGVYNTITFSCASRYR
jgi:hypothetical protein